jgi:hypothetical protein
MRNLPAIHGFETIVRDDLRRVEILELGRIRARFLRKADQLFGAIHISVMVGGDVCYEISGVVYANCAISEFNVHNSSNSVDSEMYPVGKSSEICG